LSFVTRPTFLLAVLALALAVPVALSAGASGDGTLSVKRGRGVVALKFRGTVVGRLTNGSVQIKDFRLRDGKDPQFLNCKTMRFRGATTTCKGRNVSFRSAGARYNVRIAGNGINLSVVGKGTVMVDGNGDLGTPDGTMSLNGEPYASLPDFPTTLVLSTLQPGG
jgi:hypothetical protein